MNWEERTFAITEVTRWMEKGFMPCPIQEEKRETPRNGQVFLFFAAVMSVRQRLMMDYKRADKFLNPRTFPMDHLADLAPAMWRGVHMFITYLTDG